MASFGVFDEKKEQAQNWVGSDLGYKPPPVVPEPPSKPVDLGWGNWAGTSGARGTPIANTTPINKPLLDLTNDLTKQSGPAGNLDSLKKPKLAGGAENPLGTNEMTFGINDFNAGQNVAAIESGKAANPWDAKMQDVIGRIESLSGNLVPSSSGYLGDTFRENYGALAQMKNLRGIAEMIKPLTTEGMNIPAALIKAQSEKKLSPEQAAYYNAHTNLLGKQAEVLTPKPEMESQKEVYKVLENQSKMIQNLIEGNPKMSIEEARKKARETHSMPMKTIPEVDAAGNKKVTYIDGTIEYFDKDGKPLKPKGVPQKKE